jgi:GT2 family glycosyltransferase
MKKITIIIVSFKSDKAIYNCLSSVNRKYPVIVIENSSDFAFKKKIEEKYKNVKCILTKKNLGFGKANNIGLYAAKTNYVLLLNPDTKLKKDTVSILIKNANKIKNFALLAPIIVNEKDKNYGFFQNKNILNKNNANNLFEVDFVKGFAMFFNKKKFKKIKFFDEKIFLYLEEIDLCKRIKDAGEKNYIIPSAKIYHAGGMSHDLKFSYELELSRNWHWMWSLFYYNKKHYGFFCAFEITIGKLISSFFKFIFYIFIFRIDKSKIYLCRLLGLINSYLNRRSSYRPKV